MKPVYDVIIAGTGAIGSAAAYYLAKRNIKVLAIDRFTPPHTLGSSHGESRIIREAYFEGPEYVPIVRRAYENWEYLSRESGRTLYRQTGGLMLGLPESRLVSGARLSAETHRLPFDILDEKEIKKYYPPFHLHPGMIGIREPRAGILFPEECIRSFIEGGTRLGADYLFDEPVMGWEVNQGFVRVNTASGIQSAKLLLLTSGSWITSLIPDMNWNLEAERQVLYWFEAAGDSNAFHPGKFPVFILEFEEDRSFYGFPDLGKGIKMAFHHHGMQTDPDRVNREVSNEEVEKMRATLEQFIPGASGKLIKTQTCLYTNTPDHHFRIGFHPRYEQVLAASICSGHGFKFASAMGEILANLLADGKTDYDISLFTG